jgi:hypothetical protein
VKKERKSKRKRNNRNEKCAICGLPRRKHNVLGHYFLRIAECNIDQ